ALPLSRWRTVEVYPIEIESPIRRAGQGRIVLYVDVEVHVSSYRRSRVDHKVAQGFAPEPRRVDPEAVGPGRHARNAVRSGCVRLGAVDSATANCMKDHCDPSGPAIDGFRIAEQYGARYLRPGGLG